MNIEFSLPQIRVLFPHILAVSMSSNLAGTVVVTEQQHVDWWKFISNLNLLSVVWFQTGYSNGVVCELNHNYHVKFTKWCDTFLSKLKLRFVNLCTNLHVTNFIYVNSLIFIHRVKLHVKWSKTLMLEDKRNCKSGILVLGL